MKVHGMLRVKVYPMAMLRLANRDRVECSHQLIVNDRSQVAKTVTVRVKIGVYPYVT